MGIKKIDKHRFNKLTLVKISILILIIFITSIIWIKVAIEKKENASKESRIILKEINDLCNNVGQDIENNEIKYINLLKNEKDDLKTGIYASALVQINTIKGNYDGMKKYGEIATQSYLKVPNGELYAISEKKYLAWTMFKVGKYSESIKLANEIMNLDKENILTDDEIIDTDVLIYTIFINIYSEFKLLDEAKVYYDKLCEVKITPELEYSRGEKIAYSKMVYAEAIEDYVLMKKYADETYNIAVKLDEVKGTSTASKMLINCAYANIKVGNFEEAFNQVKKSEITLIENDDNHSLVLVNSLYGDYYKSKYNVDKALEYYSNAIEISKTLENDFRLSELLSEFIDYSYENNRINEADDYYKLFFELTKEVSTEPAFNELLEEVLNTNDILNKEKINQENIKKQIAKRSNIIFNVMILSLVVFLIILLYLLRKRNESEKKLEEIANRDFLTKTNTRAYGYELINNIIKNNQMFSIAIIDIDDFKLLNDTYGHLFGDEVLKKIAEVLIMEIGEDNIIIRFGGEEFLVVLIETSKENGKKFLDKALEKVVATTFENNINVSFSCGIANWDNTNIENVISKADELLYKCKIEGKNNVYI